VIIAVANLKGGVGKSTLAVNLSSALTAKGRALLVDADEQGTSTYYAAKKLLPVESLALPFGPAEDVHKWVGRILALKADYLVIDAPPHTGPATQAIVGVADIVLVPVGPSVADIAATARAVDLVRRARDLRKGNGPYCLLIPCRVDTRTTSGRELPEVLKSLGEPIGPTIHQRAAFVDAMTAGEWVGSYAPTSDAHKDVLSLADAVRRKRK